MFTIENEIKNLYKIDCSIGGIFTDWLIAQYLIKPFDIQEIKNYLLDYYNLINNEHSEYIFKLKNINELISIVDNIKTNNKYDIILDNDDVIIVKPTDYYMVQNMVMRTTSKDFKRPDLVESSVYYCRIKKEEIKNKLNIDSFTCLINNHEKSFRAEWKYLKNNLLDNYYFSKYFTNDYTYNNAIPSNLKILEQDEINGDLYVLPYDYDNLDIKCKRINGNVILMSGFTEIPKFLKNVEVSENFICSHNSLNNLINCPQSVNSIDCQNNGLISLKGAPNYLRGNFDCSANNLKNLYHAPKIIEGKFYCCINNITTLIGAPIQVGSFICRYNKITSLIGITQIVDKNINCTYNEINNLDGLPDIINGSLFLSGNNITTLKNAPKIIKDEFKYDKTDLIDDYIPKYNSDGILTNEI